MIIRHKNTIFDISPLFFIITAMLLIFDRSGFMGYSVMFSLLHEAGHILMMFFFKKPPRVIKLKFYGLEIKTSAFSTREEIFISFAGPAVNFITAFICALFNGELFNVLMMINLVMAVFNLLPIDSLDGGDILRAMLQKHYPSIADKLLTVISCTVAIAVTVAGLYLIFYGNIGIFIIGCYLLFINLIKSN